MRPDIADSEVFPRDYSVYRKDRTRLGGGVFLLIHSSLNSSLLDLGHVDVESIWCKITLADSSSFAAGVFYRPPDSNLNTLQLLHEIVSEASGQTFVLAGDFNLPELMWQNEMCQCKVNSRANLEMKSIVDTFGLSQYVKEPTRNDNILDLLFCNSPSFVNSVVTIPGISDHHAIVASIRTKTKRQKSNASRRVFLFEKGDYSNISKALRDHLPVFECLAEDSDVHKLWSLFKSKLLDLVEKYIPSIDSTRLKKRKKPWMTSAILRLRKRRRRAFIRYKRTKSDTHLQKLSEITHEYDLNVRSAKAQYFEKLSDCMKTNSKLFWKYIKNCGSDPVGISEIVQNGQVISDDAEKATCLNNYFQSVFLAKCSYQSISYTSGVPEMPPVEFSVSGIETLLQNIDETKASGPDGISPRVLKRCAQAISPYLYLIYTQSLATSVLPDDWKVAHVVPIHKGGPKKDVSNYRPISLTSILCKIIEHVFYSQIVSHLNANNLIISEQHGFCKGLSCTTQLAEFFHELVSGIDERRQTDCIFLDFRKAFDTVSHSLLLQKLKIFNLDSTVIRWIESYLSQRRQCVVLNGKQSDYVDVTSGVPQGSVLGPLLFLIYINDISSQITSRIRLFADDCVLYRSITSEHDAEQLQSDLVRVENWCCKWKMNLNPKKCVHLSFTRSKKKIDTQYSINNDFIKTECTYKYLGVILSNDCSWNAQVDDVVLRAGRALNFIQRNLKCSETNLKKTAYLTCVRPILEYACVVWDPAQKYLIEKLEKIQNRAARFVLGRYGQKDSCTDMKRELNWELLSARRNKLKLKFLFSIFNGRLGINKDDYLKQPHYISSRTDHCFKIREYRARTNMYANSFFVKTIQQWNKLSEEQVCSATEELFFSRL